MRFVLRHVRSRTSRRSRIDSHERAANDVVIPHCASAQWRRAKREPGIHNHHREYGFSDAQLRIMAHAFGVSPLRTCAMWNDAIIAPTKKPHPAGGDRAGPDVRNSMRAKPFDKPWEARRTSSRAPR